MNIHLGGGCTDYVNENGSITIQYYKPCEKRVEIIDNSTGIEINITDSAGVGEICKYFTGDKNTFFDISKWKNDISLYSSYKGLLEFMMQNFPDSKLYWCIPYVVNADFTSEKFMNKYINSSDSEYLTGYEELYDVQRKVCAIYNIPIIDIYNDSGITIKNASNYFYSNNVHPNEIGYKKYAEIIMNSVNK